MYPTLGWAPLELIDAFREINLRANIVSEFIKNHVIPKELSTGAIDLIKSIFRSVIVFLDVIVNQAGSQQEVMTSEQQGQKG